jgi:tetratricopeptide (TPR) repeat protein
MAISFAGSVSGRGGWGTSILTGPDPLPWREEGVRRRALGDKAGAAAAFTRYLASPVRLPALQKITVVQRAGNVRTAEQMVRAFLAQQPHDPVAFRILGQLAITAGRPDGGERIFRQIVALAPAFLPVRFELAQALLLQGKSEAALAEAERLLCVSPDQLAFCAIKADALAQSGEFAAALEIYAALTARRPEQPSLWTSYGFLLRTVGRSADAVAAFRCALKEAPHLGEAWWHLANMKVGLLAAADQAAIAAALASDRPNAEDRYHLHFALARALEEGGEHERAFAEYKRANAARASLLPPARSNDPAMRADRMIATFTPALMRSRATAGNPSTEPIFILGMPRSGSTLVEQILAAHPDIEGTHELPYIPQLARELDGVGSAQHGAYPAILATRSDAQLRALGTEYLRRAARQRKSDRSHFLDKQPANWMHVGLIRLIMPNARIIDVRRDPMACCLSMFRQHFARGADFTYSIEQLAAEYRAYDRTMAHWQTVAPGKIYRLDLSKLQDDLSSMLHELLSYLGLPFAEECLDFHRSARAVFTPSSEQVRRPINREGDTVMAAYEPFTKELRDALGDLAN